MSIANPSMRAKPPRFETGASTHVGKVRRLNEDSYLTNPKIGVWAVADGMGGHEAGDLASATVVEALSSIPKPASARDMLASCEASIIAANGRVHDYARQHGSVVGTTVAVLLTYDVYYACVWSGDSRIYLVRGGSIVQLSRDHTEMQDLIDEGKLSPSEAATFARRNVITRAIGVHENPELEMIHGELERGDAFIICSDGLTGHVADNEILEAVWASPAQAACDALVALTLERGANDNVTVVVVRFKPGRGAGATTRHPWE
jgi:serine/threonine protein phosphatase PrpC